MVKNSKEAKTSPHNNRALKNKCVNCGKPCRVKYCRREYEHTCKRCGKITIKVCHDKIAKYCHGSCAAGDPDVIKRVKDTQLKKYGAYGFNTKKQEETMLRKYGVKVPYKNEEIKNRSIEKQKKNNGGVLAFNTQKQRDTMMKKYGSLGRLGDPRELKRQHETMVDRYGVKTPSEHRPFHEKAMDSIVGKHGGLFNNSTISKVNLKWKELIEKEFNTEVESEVFIDGYFYDLMIKDSYLLIEVNPTVTHNSTKPFGCLRSKCSTFPCSVHSPTSKDYHKNKALSAQEFGYKLIQIYDWDNIDQIIAEIRKKLEDKMDCLQVENLNIKVIGNKKYEIFLSQHGGIDIEDCPTRTHLGLYTRSDQELVAVMSIKHHKNEKCKITNYCEHKDYKLSKVVLKLVLEWIHKECPIVKEVIFLLDFDKNTGEMNELIELGFIEEGISPTRYIVKYKATKPHPISIQKNKANEIQQLIKNGYVEIYTAGHRNFVLKYTNNI